MANTDRLCRSFAQVEHFKIRRIPWMYPCPLPLASSVLPPPSPLVILSGRVKEEEQPVCARVIYIYITKTARLNGLFVLAGSM